VLTITVSTPHCFLSACVRLSGCLHPSDSRQRY